MWLLSAMVVHGFGLQQALFGTAHLYLGWALALSTAIWLGLLVFWLESLVLRIDGLQLLLLPTAALACSLAAAFPQGLAVPHAANLWLRVHLLIALTAYGLIAIAALQAMQMAFIDRHLHHPLHASSARSFLDRVLDSQPPLLLQEQLLFRLIWVGFMMLTLTVVSGSLASLRLSGSILPFDHKTVFTLLSWLTFGVLLLGRHGWGWRGRVALRWTLTGCVFLVLAYTGSRFVLATLS
jgi:ABC-type uncharacterized transport system permease subunit